jgi:hypothetical protein
MSAINPRLKAGWPLAEFCWFCCLLLKNESHGERPSVLGSPPVWTDQPNFFAGIQLKRSIHEEQLLAILLIDV